MKIDKTQEENWETQDPAHREVTGTSRVLERIAGILSYFGSSRCRLDLGTMSDAVNSNSGGIPKSSN